MFDVACWVIIFLMTVIVHEVCHGLAAFMLGDRTARDAGRLTLNPLRHIDLFWTVLFPAALFFTTQGRFAIGMAKPVPVNFARLRNPRRDMILVAMAGPLANFFLAGMLNFFFKLNGSVYLLYAIYFNLGIMLFNLIPIPPLDGSRIVAGLLPPRAAYYYLKIEPFGFAIILALYMTHVLLYWIVPGLDFFTKLFDIPGILSILSQR